jgi:hypothetical protein
VCLFSWRYNTLRLYFHSPVAGFSLLVFARFLDNTLRRATVGRNTLDERSIRHRDLYLTTHNTHNRHTSMTPMGFEPTISAGERPKTPCLRPRVPLGPFSNDFCEIKSELSINYALSYSMVNVKHVPCTPKSFSSLLIQIPSQMLLLHFVLYFDSLRSVVRCVCLASTQH